MSERKRTKEEQSIDAIIDRLLKINHWDDKMVEMDIINGWAEIMGKGVAHRTESIRFNNNIMYLKLNSSVMRDELQQAKRVIIQKVNQKAGKDLVKDIWFE